MYQEWSLQDFYSGTDDPALENDMARLEELIAQFKAAVAALSPANARESLKRTVAVEEEMSVLARKLGSYFNLRRSAHSPDPDGARYSTRLQNMMASKTKESVIFRKFIGALADPESVIAGDEMLEAYRFHFSQIQSNASHRLSDEAEDVFARMNLSGGRAWGDLFAYLTANVTVDYKGEKTSLSAVRGLAESDDAAERKAAYEAELACYGKIRDSIAFALNSIKAQVNTEAELRGYESPLDMTLNQSRMKKETLDAMFAAMREAFPKFHAYLRHKAKLLGYRNGLPWYELLAPMGKADGKNYTAEEAHAYLVEHFSSFAPDLAEMVDTAFREEWIDFYPRKGKVGGAFCSNLPFMKQSRILTNFTGTFGSITTLAHELGHAYHGKQIEGHRPLNTGYTMPVAETASNFNELIIVNHAIENAEGEEKIRLIETQIQDMTQIIIDIYSRFLFEDEVFRRRRNTFLFADDLEQIMIRAQKEAFGDGLDPAYLHPYMWCCKSHYYRAGLSYYNFPYAFGGLFSRGLYARYLEEGEAFLPKYRALLKATTVDTVENVARIAGIDLTEPDFWRKSLATVTEQIDLFIRETSV
ncbi:MAG: M3 family oligoendopeptidase [Clostridia bacterium]|nr:M3 family oligoendopeptidase [Clostridia bacterium]